MYVASVTLCGRISACMQPDGWLRGDTAFPLVAVIVTAGSNVRSRMETKPVITCLKTLLIVYSFVFWVRTRPVPCLCVCLETTTTLQKTIVIHRCVRVFVVRDEGADSPSIIDGIMLLFLTVFSAKMVDCASLSGPV